MSDLLKRFSSQDALPLVLFGSPLMKTIWNTLETIENNIGMSISPENMNLMNGNIKKNNNTSLESGWVGLLLKGSFLRSDTNEYRMALKEAMISGIEYPQAGHPGLLLKINTLIQHTKKKKKKENYRSPIYKIFESKIECFEYIINEMQSYLKRSLNHRGKKKNGKVYYYSNHYNNNDDSNINNNNNNNNNNKQFYYHNLDNIVIPVLAFVKKNNQLNNQLNNNNNINQSYDFQNEIFDKDDLNAKLYFNENEYIKLLNLINSPLNHITNYLHLSSFLTFVLFLSINRNEINDILLLRSEIILPENSFSLMQLNPPLAVSNYPPLQSEPKHALGKISQYGYMILDDYKRAVFLLPNDPLLINKPSVGIWFTLNNNVDLIPSLFWMAATIFLNSKHLNKSLINKKDDNNNDIKVFIIGVISNHTSNHPSVIFYEVSSDMKYFSLLNNNENNNIYPYQNGLLFDLNNELDDTKLTLYDFKAEVNINGLDLPLAPASILLLRHRPSNHYINFIRAQENKEKIDEENNHFNLYNNNNNNNNNKENKTLLELQKMLDDERNNILLLTKEQKEKKENYEELQKKKHHDNLILQTNQHEENINYLVDEINKLKNIIADQQQYINKLRLDQYDQKNNDELNEDINHDKNNINNNDVHGKTIKPFYENNNINYHNIDINNNNNNQNINILDNNHNNNNNFHNNYNYIKNENAYKYYDERYKDDLLEAWENIYDDDDDNNNNDDNIELYQQSNRSFEIGTWKIKASYGEDSINLDEGWKETPSVLNLQKKYLDK